MAQSKKQSFFFNIYKKNKEIFMKKVLFTILMVAALLIGLTGTVFAAGPVEYTIDVRNRTGQSVELNYTGADQVIHQVSIAKGVSSLTIPEGVYSYWASLKCGNISGSINLSQQAQILWLTCDTAAPSVKTTGPQNTGSIKFLSCANGPGAYEYSFFDWNQRYVDDATAWLPFFSNCYNQIPQAGDGEWSSTWSVLFNDYDDNGDPYKYWYDYYENGLDPADGCGFANLGEGFYYTGTPGAHDHCN
jgi:YD repeat-containing protein